MKTPILLLLGLLAATLTSSATASTWVESRSANIQEWTPYIIAGTDQVEETFTFTLPQDGYIEVQDVRCTGDRSRIVVDGAAAADEDVVADLPYECEDQETHPELAKCHGKYWRRTINIRAGQHQIKFPTIRSSLNRGVGYFRIQIGEPNPGTPPRTSGRFFVSKRAKVGGRAAAARECEAQDAYLAELRATDFLDVRNTVIDANIGRNAWGLHQVWISSYNTDRYENTNLLYSVHPNELSSGAVGKDFENQQLYPLCERNTPQPPPPAPSCPVALALSADLRVVRQDAESGIKLVGPAEDHMLYTSYCKALELEPFVVHSGQWDTWAKATGLVAAHGQQDAWVYGYDTPSNLPLTIQTAGVVVPAGTLGQLVPAVDNSAKKLFLCKSSAR